MPEKVILLVEDSPDDIELTMRAFKQNNIMNKVLVAQDGEEALDYLFARNGYADRSPEEDPVVVLLDLKLPKVDGLQVLREMRADKRTQLTPVVVLTSSTEERDLCESYSMGANSYVRKPVDFIQFSEAVKQLELYWLVLNEAPPNGM
jgi:two-component system, response regulator